MTALAIFHLMTCVFWRDKSLLQPAAKHTRVAGVSGAEKSQENSMFSFLFSQRAQKNTLLTIY